jgi:hypothetical protein
VQHYFVCSLSSPRIAPKRGCAVRRSSCIVLAVLVPKPLFIAPIHLKVWLPEVVEENQIVLKTKVRVKGQAESLLLPPVSRACKLRCKRMFTSKPRCWQSVGRAPPCPAPLVGRQQGNTGTSYFYLLAPLLCLQGLPFCVAGLGDMLALFRCISCRFAFGTNVQRPNTLGAPGRVFTSSEVGAV